MEAIAAVGVAASIVQLAGAGLQLSVILYEYVDSVSGADKRIKAIARDVELTSAVIQELGHTFSQNGTAQVMTASSIQTAESAVKECRYVFDELEAIVARSKDSRMAKFTMPFKDSKIQLLRANLDRWKSTLQLLMQALLHAQMVRNNDQDRAEVLRQRKELKRLIEAKKAAIKRYEDTMKATSSSEDSTLVEDLEPPERMQPGPKAMPSLGIKTFTAFVSSLAVPNKDNANHNDLENLNRDLDLNASVDQEGNTMSIDKTLTTPGVGSPKLLRTGRDKRGLITNESLALCIQHIQSLLQNIEVVESQLDQYAGQTTQTIEAEMQLQAAYAKTRDALDTIIDGTEKHSSTNKIKYNQRASSCGYCDNRGILCIHVGIEARSKGHKASTRLAYMRGCRTCRADRRKCDDETPRCGRCVRRDLSCEYRASKPDGKQGLPYGRDVSSVPRNVSYDVDIPNGTYREPSRKDPEYRGRGVAQVSLASATVAGLVERRSRTPPFDRRTLVTRPPSLHERPIGTDHRISRLSNVYGNGESLRGFPDPGFLDSPQRPPYSQMSSVLPNVATVSAPYQPPIALHALERHPARYSTIPSPEMVGEREWGRESWHESIGQSPPPHPRPSVQHPRSSQGPETSYSSVEPESDKRNHRIRENRALRHKSHIIFNEIDSTAAGKSTPSTSIRIPQTTGNERNRRRSSSAASSSPAPQWIQYKPDEHRNGRLMPESLDYNKYTSRHTRGRSGPLTPAAREAAQALRTMKNCDSCRRRKIKCDIQTPCRNCVKSFERHARVPPCRGVDVQSQHVEALHSIKPPTEQEAKPNIGVSAAASHVTGPETYICCDQCRQRIWNEHLHCNLCDDGDYDLCNTCAKAGLHCYDPSHHMVQRQISSGQVVDTALKYSRGPTKVRQGSMSLGQFLENQDLGEWADEMNSLGTPVESATLGHSTSSKDAETYPHGPRLLSPTQSAIPERLSFGGQSASTCPEYGFGSNSPAVPALHERERASYTMASAAAARLSHEAPTSTDFPSEIPVLKSAGPTWSRERFKQQTGLPFSSTEIASTQKIDDTRTGNERPSSQNSVYDSPYPQSRDGQSDVDVEIYDRENTDSSSTDRAQSRGRSRGTDESDRPDSIHRLPRSRGRSETMLSRSYSFGKYQGTVRGAAAAACGPSVLSPLPGSDLTRVDASQQADGESDDDELDELLREWTNVGEDELAKAYQP